MSASKPSASVLADDQLIRGSAFGVYLSFFLEGDHYPGATKLHYAFIGGLTNAAALLMSSPANYRA